MSLRFILQVKVALVLSFLNITYACDHDDSMAVVPSRTLSIEFLERYAPATLPMSLFKKLGEHGNFTHDTGITYSVDDKTEFSTKLPYNLPVSDRLLGHQEKIDVKSITQELLFAPKDIGDGFSKLILNYTYAGRWLTGPQTLKFYAHIQPQDEALASELKAQQDKGTSLDTFEMDDNDVIKIFHQDGEELIGTIELENGEDEKAASLSEKIQGMVKFVGPYILNDVVQGQVTKVIPESILAVANMASAQAGYDTVVHAALQSPSEAPQEDPLDQKRAELTKRSEAIGAVLTPIPGATKIRTALNLACQYAGYDSATHWWHGVASKMKGDTVELDSYQRKINLAKGAARLAIVMFVPGGKFVIIGSKIYEFVQGKSITETVVDKVVTS